jgi:hypothetical protein
LPTSIAAGDTDVATQAPQASRRAAPPAAKAAAIVTWIYAACFGLPAIPVAVYLLRAGRLPRRLFDAFPVYGGPWYDSGQPERLAAQLGAFFVMMLVVSWGGWLLWRGLRAGAVVAIATIPLEALSGTASRCLSRPCSRWSASCWCSLRGPGCAAARSGPEGHAARLAWKAEWLMRSLTGRRIPGS